MSRARFTTARSVFETFPELASKSAVAATDDPPIVFLKNLSPELRQTITFDNGKEFSEHEALARHLGIDVYFAHPYASWERGTSENTNRLLRQYYPKGTDFAEVSHYDLASTVESINQRPRKCLGYQTPSEVFFGNSSSLRCD